MAIMPPDRTAIAQENLPIVQSFEEGQHTSTHRPVPARPLCAVCLRLGPGFVGATCPRHQLCSRYAARASRSLRRFF